MINALEIPEFLDEVEKLNLDVVHSSLPQGQEFSTHPYPTSTNYKVDDPNVHLELDFEKDFGEFLIELDRRIQGIYPSQILNHYFPPGVKVCKLSQVVRDCIGMCLEKSAMVALRTAEAPSSHLVKGLLAAQRCATHHAFNILGQTPDTPRLVDAQNPIIVNSGGTRTYYPFMFPLDSFDPDTRRFIFQEPYESQLQWSYHLPMNARLP